MVACGDLRIDAESGFDVAAAAADEFEAAVPLADGVEGEVVGEGDDLGEIFVGEGWAVDVDFLAELFAGEHGFPRAAAAGTVEVLADERVGGPHAEALLGKEDAATCGCFDGGEVFEVLAEPAEIDDEGWSGDAREVQGGTDLVDWAGDGGHVRLRFGRAGFPGGLARAMGARSGSCRP